LLPICYGLNVLMTETAHRNDHIHRVAVHLDIEFPFPGLDTCDSLLLGKLPKCAVSVLSANGLNAGVGVGAVRFIDTFDFMPNSYESLCS
jgi:hypothetical protein